MFADGKRTEDGRKASSDGTIYLSIMVLLASEGSERTGKWGQMLGGDRFLFLLFLHRSGARRSQKGVCESLNGSIALVIDVLF